MTTTPHQATEEPGSESSEEWKASSEHGESGKTNVGRTERIASAVLGGTVVLQGLRRRGLRGMLMAVGGTYLVYRGASGQCGLYGLLGVDRSGSTVDSAEPDVSQAAPEVERSVTVGRPAEELHQYWRDPEHLNELLGDWATIEERGADRLHWTVEGPLDRTMEWETEFVEDREGEVLRWETVEGTRLPSEWTVRYQDAPGEQGTEVSLRVRFDPPGGKVGAALVERLGVAPKAIVEATLRRFRSLAETGEVPTLERNPSARGAGDVV